MQNQKNGWNIVKEKQEQNVFGFKISGNEV